MKMADQAIPEIAIRVRHRRARAIVGSGDSAVQGRDDSAVVGSRSLHPPPLLQCWKNGAVPRPMTGSMFPAVTSDGFCAAVRRIGGAL